MWNRISRIVLSAACGLALFVFVPQVQAQQQGAPPAEAPQEQLTDAQLREFARVYMKVQEIGLQHQEALAEVQDAEEAQRLQEQAAAEMTEVVREHDLTTERYTQIVQVLNEDEELRERFGEIVEELSRPQP